MRRLPVYLLIDVSYSMTGEPLNAVQKGVEFLIDELRKNPYALETAWISLITFGSEATTEVELTELPLFQTPQLSIDGMTSLGKALSLLSDKIFMDVRLNTSTQKGDWKPLVFIMTDGAPTDDWKQGLKKFKQQQTGVVVACAAGKNADTNVLLQITDNVVQIDSPDQQRISDFFKWVSDSIQVSSTKADNGENTDSFSHLPPAPKGIDLVKH
ncbi:MAG: VWA domain-containing protein [Marinifilaceae bacterium]|jgi:uncharacterized protein YegL|nr:VWA domain-containing protein [Marinifilaceae bacterium]